MKGHVIDYVKSFDHRLNSPIWGGKKEFSFLCYGHLDLSWNLGFELKDVTPVLTIVKENQLTTDEQLDALISKHAFRGDGFEEEVSYLKEMIRENPDHWCGGGCFGPLTVVSGILGAENMLKMLVKNPDFVEKFLDYVTGFLIELAKREAEAGQDFFWVAEPLLSLLSPKNAWRFSGQFLKRIFDAAEAPGFLHVCGKTAKHTPYMVQTGAEVLSIDYCTDIGECIRMVDENIVVMGNVNPSTLRFGTREDVEREVRAVFDACRGFPNLVLSTGCSIMGGTPDENMQVLEEMAQNERTEYLESE